MVPVSLPAASAASAPEQAASSPEPAAVAVKPTPPPPVGRVIVSGQWSPRCVNALTMEAAPGRALTAALVAGAWAPPAASSMAACCTATAPRLRYAAARRVRTPASPYPASRGPR